MKKNYKKVSILPELDNIIYDMMYIGLGILVIGTIATLISALCLLIIKSIILAKLCICLLLLTLFISTGIMLVDAMIVIICGLTNWIAAVISLLFDDSE